MSGVDQPIVIAQSGFHVGHQRQWRAAEEQGFVKEEGLERYVYEQGGLIPAKFEAEALGLQMWERGVDIATAVNVWSAIVQRARGEDVYIIGGWRTLLAPKLIGAKGITRPEELKGTKSVIRDTAGMGFLGIVTALRTFGVGREDIEWIKNPLVGYGNDPAIEDLLRSGQIQFLPLSGARASRLVSEGYSLVLDLEEFYRRSAAWPTGRVIVATTQTIEQRGEELRAFLRATLRGFWFARDPRNRRYMYDLETRLRQTTFNEDERKLRILSAEGVAEEESRGGMGPMVMDGLVNRAGLAHVIEGMVQFGELERSVEVDEVLKDAASLDAYQQLLNRGLIDPEVIEQYRSAKGYATSEVK